MIIALANEDGSLYLFESIADAEREFEAIDVQNGEYQFFDAMGQTLRPELTSLITAFHPGDYRLVPSNGANREEFVSAISAAKVLARATNSIQTIDDLRRSILHPNSSR